MADSTRRRFRTVALAALVLVLHAPPSGAPLLPLPDQVIPPPSRIYENEFGPDGSKCPGACGQGCPASCRQEDFTRCNPENPVEVQSGERFTCGINPACSELDDCMDECAFDGILGGSTIVERLLGVEPAWAPVFPIPPGVTRSPPVMPPDQLPKGQLPPNWKPPPGQPPPGWIEPPDKNPDFGDAACNAACVSAAASSTKNPLEAYSWAEGGGPYTDAATWEYTQDSPAAPENNRPCGRCEVCRNGDCVHDPEACPPGGGDEPPPPGVPMISSGDVHMTTLDRRRYDYQGVGEYVLIENEAKSFVLQARTKPWSNYASLNSAVAMRVGDDVLGFYVDPDFRILRNTQPVEIANGEYLELDGGGRVDRQGHVFAITWPDGSVVRVYQESISLAIAARLGSAHAGKVRGMVGDFDGDPGNDIATRAGEAMPPRMTSDQLYGEFGHSWRIDDSESLFVYAAGESTVTFTDRDFPRAPLELSSLDAAVLAAAEKACAGIGHPRLYRDCLFDVAVTGDASYAAVHAADVPPASEVEPPYMDFAAADDLGIEAPAEVPAGSEFLSSWSGTRRVGDYIGVAEPGVGALDHLSYGIVPVVGQVTLRAPELPGRYSIRYVQGNSIAFERPVDVTQAVVTLDAAESAPGGSRIEIDWSGPGGDSDHIGIIPLTVDDKRRSPNYGYPRMGDPLPMTVPDIPGDYEIQYVDGQTQNVLRARALRVTPVTATLDAPDEAPSGSPIDVAWIGPGNDNDYIGIYAVAGDDAGTGLTYKYTRQGNPLNVNVPDAPGTYEVRYVQGQSGTALFAHTLVVTAVTAELDAPDEAPSGSTIEVSWTGPGNESDYVSIFAADSDAARRGQEYKYTRQGNPLSLQAPDEPGDYEIQYVQGQSRTALTARRFTVTPVTATLDAAADAIAGGQLAVGWTGPGNPSDYVGIFVVEGENAGRGVSYQYTRTGNPLQIAVPDAPGTYENRYVQGQSRTELVSQKLTVRKGD